MADIAIATIKAVVVRKTEICFLAADLVLPALRAPLVRKALPVRQVRVARKVLWGSRVL